MEPLIDYTIGDDVVIAPFVEGDEKEFLTKES